MTHADLTIRPLEPASDLAWAEALLDRDWGGRRQARRGELLDVLDLPGLVAKLEGRLVGLLLYRPDGDECEIAFMAVLKSRRGVGTALLGALPGAVPGCARIWVVTTNDNVDALRFYQR